MDTPPSFDDGEGNNMNAYLWAELQNFIDLSMIYAKLPLAPFFRLRQVCKEWNHLASNRQFLEQNFKAPISINPYFVIHCPNGGHILLTSESSSWSSMPVPRMRCEVSGLLFEDSNRNRVFDLHTRVFHTLPPYSAMEQERRHLFKDPLTWMTVDTTSIPYKFRVIFLNKFIGTKVYDSNSGVWMHIPCNLLTPPYCVPFFGTSWVQYNKYLYIRDGCGCIEFKSIIQTYDLEKNEWNSLVLKFPAGVLRYSDIGVWQDRWYVFALNTWTLDLTVWECKSVPNFEVSWKLFDCMPKDLFKWIQGNRDARYGAIMNKFCGEHILVYNTVRAKKRALLYNLDRKTWDKIELPTTLMSQKKNVVVKRPLYSS